MTKSDARVLVVDDRAEMGDMLADGLRDRGYDAVSVDSGARALELLASEKFSALVTDLRMPDVDGLALLAAAQRLSPAPTVIVMTAFGAIDSAIESIRRGASHYLTKPFKLDELVAHLEEALTPGAEGRKVREEGPRFVAKSESMRALLDAAARVATTDATVLLTGETGTGKTALARYIHQQSIRAAAPFVALNCAALTESLLESELFGHVKGAFTGATSERVGLFREADGGTLFLDEIGELPAGVQAKLLRVLETGLVRPVGASKERTANFRLIAATHQELRDRVKAGTFRADLLYRLEVVPLHVPPLRARRDDSSTLLDEVLSAARLRHPRSPVLRLSDATRHLLLAHEWPGNVRELMHLVERLVILGAHEEASLSDLPGSPALPSPTSALTHGDVLPIREVQRRYAAWALAQCGGHRGHAAEKLGVDGKTLAKWLAEKDE